MSGQEFPDAKHKACETCPSHCCTKRFGWDNVALLPSDLENKPLMKAMKKAKIFNANDGRPLMAISDPACVFTKEGKCSIYAFRPVACRSFLCVTTDLPHFKGPVRTDFKEWRAHLAAHGFTHDANGYARKGAHQIYMKAVADSYGLTMHLVGRPGGKQEVLMRWEQDGQVHVVRDIERLKQPLQGHARRFLRDHKFNKQGARVPDERLQTARLLKDLCSDPITPV